MHGLWASLMRGFSRSLDGKLIRQLSYMCESKYVGVELCVFNCGSAYFELVKFIMVVRTFYMCHGYVLIILFLTVHFLIILIYQ
jgi:hypothetical protein